MTDHGNLTIKDRAEYLLNRRFPFARAFTYPPSLKSGRNLAPTVTAEMRQRIESYRAELAAMPADALVARYNEEQEREYEAAVAKAEQEERERFFNQPYANADFAYWSKMAHRSLDEAVALSLGKDPSRVNWQAVNKSVQISRFAVEYARRRELAVRAVPWKQLYDPVLPTIFLAWAKRNDIEVPAALVAEVEKRAGQVVDWKLLYEKAVAARKRDFEAVQLESADRVNQLSRRLAAERSDWETISRQKDQQIEALSARLSELEQLQARQPNPEVGTRARESDPSGAGERWSGVRSLLKLRRRPFAQSSRKPVKENSAV